MAVSDLIPFIFIAVTLLGAIVQISRTRTRVSQAKKAEILLNWAFVIIIGLGGIWGFIGHTFFADRVAESIGWATGNPFQQEVAIANLSIAILGILAVRIEGTFRIATLIAYTTFMVGAGVVHIWQIITVQNMAVNNAGPALWIDILMPLVLIGLYLISIHLARDEARPSLR